MDPTPTVTESNLKLNKYSRSTPVQVLVGSDEQVYWLNTDLLCCMSPFFKKCLGNSSYAEATERVIRLPEDCPKAFDVVLDWVSEPGMKAPVDGDELEQYAKGYLLADKLMMNRCKNKITDLIRRFLCEWIFQSDLVRALPQQVLDVDSPLRTYLIDQYAFELHLRAKSFLKENDRMENATRECFERGGDFAARVLQRLLQYSLREVKLEASDDPARQTGCYYHDHTDDSKPCVPDKDESASKSSDNLSK